MAAWKVESQPPHYPVLDKGFDVGFGNFVFGAWSLDSGFGDLGFRIWGLGSRVWGVEIRF